MAMQSFRTIVKPGKAPFSITHHDRIITVGSCFSENVGRYFERYKFPISINPFGQQYNPYSITQAVRRLLAPQPYTEADLVLHDELYHSFDHHGSFSRPTATEALEHINTHLEAAAAFLQKASVLFLTFGTAHFFRLKEGGRIVSNCHKMSGSHFDFELMKPDHITAELEAVLKLLWQKNPALKVILTVSPVRYFAFGHFENSVSKGHLFTAVHELCSRYPALYYFPAYELVMDDLRDYRFFAEDMLHPNYQATGYVWETMTHTLLAPFTQSMLQELDEIVAATLHRPRNPHSQAHQKFIAATLAKMDKLEAQHGLDFSAERKKLIPQP
jgi:GSCFA family